MIYIYSLVLLLSHFLFIQTLQREGASRTVALKPADDWPSRGRIEFKAVQMRYREELPLILIDVSFNIKAGEKIGKLMTKYFLTRSSHFLMRKINCELF